MEIYFEHQQPSKSSKLFYHLIEVNFNPPTFMLNLVLLKGMMINEFLAKIVNQSICCEQFKHKGNFRNRNLLTSNR
ncbi:unnamed protein product [Schistosoma turkestanicum]|nr:unnamed protein product [Schistosoma turkestanicum]